MMPLLAQLASPAAGEAASLSGVIAPYMAVFFVAFFVAFVSTPLMRMLALRNGIIDWPDLARKAHVQPVAYLGGVAIFLGWVGGIAVTIFASYGAPDAAGPEIAQVYFPLSIVVGAAAITICGLFDDVYGISPRVKIGGQLFAAAALATEPYGTHAASSTLAVLGVELPEPIVYILGTIIIAAFVVGGCNAMNLLDGLDGLAAGVAAISALGFLTMAAIVAARTHDPAVAGALHFSDPTRIAMCLAILGALLGFLPYNFNPATIFMGDAGSLLLGYLCVTTILLFAQGGQALLLMTAALIVFALPITDTSLAIFRRKMAGQPLFSPDNKHIHHLLRRWGLSVRQSVLLMYAASATFAALGITMVAMEWRWRYVLAVFCVMYGFIIVTAYKYGQHQLILEARAKAAADAAGAALTAAPPPPEAPLDGHTHARINGQPHAATALPGTATPATGDGSAGRSL